MTEVSSASVKGIVAAKFRQAVPTFSSSDVVRAETVFGETLMEYVASPATNNSRDATFVQMRFQPSRNLIWIHDLHVESASRRGGLGRQLTNAAEEVAREMGAERVNVYPLVSARRFWEKLGYQPHPHAARVLTKPLHDDPPCRRAAPCKRSRQTAARDR